MTRQHQQEPDEDKRREPTALLYARLASKRPAACDRLIAQLISCRLMAERLGATVSAEFTDFGVSGLTTDRPGIQRLLQHLKEHPTTYVICADLSRLGRSHAVTVSLILQFEASGATTVLAKPNTLIEVDRAVDRAKEQSDAS